MESDAAACERIIQAQSPFECFELPVEAVEPDLVRNIYLKIAIRVHPDKNSSHLATQAFQILSEAFEELHDSEKQEQLLNQPRHHGPQTSHRKRKRRKPKDISDLVHQNDKWYEKDWKDVENEISRMTTEFKEHLARKQAMEEKAKEKKLQKKERKRKKIKRNLNFLYEKYGINPSDSDSEAEKNTYDYVAYVPEPQSEPHALAHELAQENAPECEPEASSSGSEEAVCWVCRRSFKSKQMLQVHYEMSELHKTNVSKAQNPWNKFKNSFSEVKEN